MTKLKRPRDTNQLAKMVVDIATDQIADKDVELTEMQTFARAGGLKGGLARREALSEDRRKEIAQQAAKTRWEKSRA